MEIQGKIIQVLPLQSGIGKASGKEWKKQEYVLETIDQFPKKICFNLWGDAIDRAQLHEGEDVTVQIDIESREFNGRWYTDVKGWRVDRGFVSLNPGIGGAPAPQPMATPQPPSYVAPQRQTAPIVNDPFGGAPTVASGSIDTSPNIADDLPF